MSKQSSNLGAGEQTADTPDICRFDDAPIYQLADGEWLHYPDFKGDLFHSPEPKREAQPLPAAEIARIAELAKLFGVCDGGRYLNDWITKADRYKSLEALLTSYVKGVELPALDVTEEDERAGQLESMNTKYFYSKLARRFAELQCRERQLKAALAQLSGVELNSANRLKD